MTTTLLLLAALAAADAPITRVTVFANQARVVRVAQVPVAGSTTFEFPALRDSIDQASVRVEAVGAEVRRVDLERLEPEKLRTAEARALLAEIDKTDTELQRLASERNALAEQRAALERLSPTVQEGPNQPPPRLAPSGWAAAITFSQEQLTRLAARQRENAQTLKKLEQKRADLGRQAYELGEPQSTSGWKVVALLTGNGTAEVSLTYLVRNARWTPTWDLQLLPDANTVNLSLAGLVGQDTGEDWTQAALTLSTAIPSSAVKAPRLATWKIGITDRFIPTPTPVIDHVLPAPVAPSLPALRGDEDWLRQQLLGAADHEAQASFVPAREMPMAQKSGQMAGKDRRARNEMPPPPPPSAPPPMAKSAPAGRPMAPAPMRVQAAPSEVVASFDAEEDEPAPMAEAYVSDKKERAAQRTSSTSLSPPPAWQPPNFGPDSPVTLAGGYDLAFTSLQKETVPHAGGTRRVALWSQKWPVSVERKLYPALAPEAYLVAELKNPSKDVLPGGPAQLYVGADPAGTAALKLVSPGEAFTLPLGLDRALKSVRNVKVVDATEGLVSKDDVTTYEVTIEIANPYRVPVAARIYDQWPLSTQKELEVKFLGAKPQATQDAVRGSLEWRLPLPAGKKTVLTFSYRLKRPKGWKLQQSEVIP